MMGGAVFNRDYFSEVKNFRTRVTRIPIPIKLRRFGNRRTCKQIQILSVILQVHNNKV